MKIRFNLNMAWYVCFMLNGPSIVISNVLHFSHLKTFSLIRKYTIFDIADCGKCQNGWEAFGNSCYFFANVKVNWTDAQVLNKTLSNQRNIFLNLLHFSRSPITIQYCEYACHHQSEFILFCLQVLVTSRL